MIKFDNPLTLTEEDANERFYPDSYIMIQCVYEDEILRGRVVAHAPLGDEELSNHAERLNKKGEFGMVILTDTKDPLDGGSLLGEIYCVEEK